MPVSSKKAPLLFCGSIQIPHQYTVLILKLSRSVYLLRWHLVLLSNAKGTSPHAKDHISTAQSSIPGRVLFLKATCAGNRISLTILKRHQSTGIWPFQYPSSYHAEDHIAYGNRLNSRVLAGHHPYIVQNLFALCLHL